MSEEYTSLVFEGGGVRGIAYVGIMRKLDERGIIPKIKNVGGSSAGSQMAALVALDFTVKEIEEIMIELPLESFKDDSCGCIRDLCRFFNEFGYNKGEFMDNYFEDIIKHKTGIKKATFQDLYEITQKHLKITGTCLETESLEIFDHVNTPDMPVSLAIHISSCIPFFFKAVKYKGKTYIDGGCLKNLPLDLFINDNGRTLAFDLISDEKEKEHKIKSIKDFTAGFVNMMLLAANRIDSINENVDVIRLIF